MNADIANACIGLVLVSAQISNIRKIYQDKALIGHTIYNCSINVAYGSWTVFYYSTLNQPYSWAVTVISALCTIIYLSQALYYGRGMPLPPTPGEK